MSKVFEFSRFRKLGAYLQKELTHSAIRFSTYQRRAIPLCLSNPIIIHLSNPGIRLLWPRRCYVFIPREFINLFGFAHERMVSPLQQPMATVPCEADGAVDLRPLYNS